MDPTGLDSNVTTTHTLTDVTAGSYSVSVMAVNENGMSQDVTATFVVEGTYASLSLAVYKFVDCAVCMCTYVVLCIWYKSSTSSVIP